MYEDDELIYIGGYGYYKDEALYFYLLDMRARHIDNPQIRVSVDLQLLEFADHSRIN